MKMGFACVGLFNPKTPSNVGSVMRAAHAFGVSMVTHTGQRYRKASTDTCGGVKQVPLIQVADIFDAIPFDCVPIAVEIVEGAVPLETFNHPPRAIYIFGPEDGSLPEKVTRRCAHVVSLPSRVCLNLAATVNVVLYDRVAKMRTGFVPESFSRRPARRAS